MNHLAEDLSEKQKKHLVDIFMACSRYEDGILGYGVGNEAVNMLTFDNVRFQYAVENFSIIDHLSFEVQDGEFVSIIGASGCGKSTIFRLVNKLLTPASGVILVDGESIETKKNYCGYMPQQDLLFPWRTVRENLMLPMEIQGGYSKEQMQKQADDALQSVGLADWGDKLRKSFPAECAREQPLRERF